jgi:hypothetical protein
MIDAFEGNRRLVSRIALVILVGAALAGAAGKEVMVDIVDRGDAYLPAEGFVETWCELMNYGGPGSAVVQGWISFQVGQETVRFEENRTITLSKFTGNLQYYRFDAPADFDGYQFGFHIMNLTNRDGSVPGRGIGGWDEGLLMILGALVLGVAIYVGLRLYAKWVRKVTDVSKGHGPATHFKPTDKDEGKP